MLFVCSKCKCSICAKFKFELYLHLLLCDMWDNSGARMSEEFKLMVECYTYLGIIIVLNEWNNVVKCLCILCIKRLPYHFVNPMASDKIEFSLLKIIESFLSCCYVVCYVDIFRPNRHINKWFSLTKLIALMIRFYLFRSDN